MLVRQLIAEISSLPYHGLNYSNVSDIRLMPNGDIFLEAGLEETSGLKDQIKDNEEIIKRLEADNKSLGEDYDKLEAENTKLFNQIAEIKDGTLSLKDLVEQNDNQAKQIAQYRQAQSSWVEYGKKKEEEVESLRARKNKATVSRCMKTGKMIAEFQGKKFYFGEEIPSEKA